MCGYYAANSLLISRVGPASLLSVYLISALVTLAISIVLYFKVDHVSRKGLFFGLFIVLALVVLACSAAIRFLPSQHWVYYTARILFSPVYILSDLEYWLVASLYLSGAESRKHFPIFVSAGIVGEIAGGLLIGYGASILHTPNLPLIWAGILFFCPFLLIGLRFPVSSRQGVGTSVIWGEMLTPGSGRKSRSPFATPLAVLLLVFWGSYAFFSHGSDYIFNVYAEKAIVGEDQLTAFFGRVESVANVLVLASQILLSVRIHARMGLERAVFFIVLLNLASWVLVSAVPELLTVTIAQIAIYFFLDHFSVSSLHTALNVFPDRIRGRIRLFTEGLGRPFGTILFFGCMVLFSLADDTLRMANLMLALGALLIPYAFIFKHYYLRHLLNGLQSKDHSIVKAAVFSLGQSSPEKSRQPLLDLLKTARLVDLKQAIIHSLRRLPSEDVFQEMLHLIDTPNDRLRLSAIEALMDYRNKEGSRALFSLLESTGDVSFRSRRKAVTVLKHHLGENVSSTLISDLVKEKDTRVIANTIEAIGLVPDHGSIDSLRPFLEHSDHRVRANAAIAVYLASGTEDPVKRVATEVIEGLFRSHDSGERSAGIFAIGVLKMKNHEKELMDLLDAEDRQLRENACVALASFKNPAFAPVFIQFLLNSKEDLAVGSARRLDNMPRSSRKLLFETLAKLPQSEVDLVCLRLKKTQLDFTDEMTLLPVAAASTPGTLQDVANLRN